jgi:hypothetical protein
MNFSCAYFGSFSCINAYIYKGLLGHKNPVPNYNIPLSRKQYAIVLFSANMTKIVDEVRVLTIILLKCYAFGMCVIKIVSLLLPQKPPTD